MELKYFNQKRLKKLVNAVNRTLMELKSTRITAIYLRDAC